MKFNSILAVLLATLQVNALRTRPQDGELFRDDHTTGLLQQLFPKLGILEEKASGERYIIYDYEDFMSSHQLDEAPDKASRQSSPVPTFEEHAEEHAHKVTSTPGRRREHNFNR